MIVKTYGVPGLSEWHGKLKVGTIEVNVSFVGGTASPSGAQPASMTTKDPITQFVIENSKEWKEGMIILLQKQEVAGTHPRMAAPKPVANENKKQEVAGTKPVANENKKPKDTGAPEKKGVGTEDMGAPLQVEVTDKRDAIDWLKEHYPEKAYTVTRLKTDEAFAAACKECGVEFTFTA